MRKPQTRLWMRKLERIIRAGFDVLIPPRCMGCGSLGSSWCEQCQQTLIAPIGLKCPSCGLPRILRECPACMNGIISLHVAAIAAYRPSLSDALVAFKYRPDAAFTNVLAGWLMEKLITLAWEPEIIVPVPLSKVRKRQRGYNQVELITSALARSSEIPHGNSILQRVRDTRSQVGLDPAARFSNLDRAFIAQGRSVMGRRVLLVDDLLTSGATILSCTEALFRGGAKHVYALTIARA